MGWMPTFIGALAAAACLLATAAPAGANPYRSPGVLADDAADGRLGQSVSISGDGTVAVVGQPGYDGGAGAALVYANADGDWRFVQRLRPTGENGDGHFGAAVSMDFDGRMLVVGAPDDDGGVGSAWAFVLTDGAWTQQGQLTGVPGSRSFGASVAAASGGLAALVGAPLSDNGMGQVFTFNYDRDYGWYRLQKMHRVGVTGAAHFGASVALTRNSGAALVGAPNAGGGDGTVYAFSHFGLESPFWIDGAAIDSPDAGANFGASVAISSFGDHAMIGAPLADGGAGAVYKFRRSGEREAVFRNPSGSTTGRFGASVALAGTSDIDQLVVGAPGDNGEPGAVYDFDGSAEADWTWNGEALDPAAPCMPGDACGTSVAVAADGSHALVGVPGARDGDGTATHFKSAYITVPDQPISVYATGGVASAHVNWGAPWNSGGSPITGYTATASPGGRSCHATEPWWGCTVVGLTPGQAYTFTVTATNSVGTSTPSAASEPVVLAVAADVGGGSGGHDAPPNPGGGENAPRDPRGPSGGDTSVAPEHGPAATKRPAKPSGPVTRIKRTRNSITFSWSPSRKASVYRISELTRGKWKPVGSATVARFTRRGLRPHSRHSFSVRAADSDGALSAPLQTGWLTTK
jgi:hypothetical protein